MLNSRDLSVLGYANGFTLWHLATADAAGDVRTSGYFDEAAEMFRPGDLILANVNRGNDAVASLFLSVVQIDRGRVVLESIGQTP